MSSAAETPLTVNWSPNLRDAYFGLRLGFWGTPVRIIRTALLLFVLPSALFAWNIPQLLGTRLSPMEILAFSVVGGLVWAVVFGLTFNAWLARRLVNIQRAKGDPQRIVITDESIERQLRHSKITHPWSAIVRIQETGPLFILMGSSGPIATIEKSGITSASELLTLRAFLRSKKPGKYLETST